MFEFAILYLLLLAFCITGKGVGGIQEGEEVPKWNQSNSWYQVGFVSVHIPHFHHKGLRYMHSTNQSTMKIKYKWGKRNFVGYCSTIGNLPEWAQVFPQVPSFKFKEKCHHIWSINISHPLRYLWYNNPFSLSFFN